MKNNKGDKETSVHKKDGWFVKGDIVGHVDKNGNIRSPDGFLYKGEEIGYVDQDGFVHRKDGFLFKGEVIGQVRGNTAYGKDGLLLRGEEWGYVDDDGNVRQKDGVLFKGRIIGQMRGHNKAGALAFYVLRFDKLLKRFEELKNKVRSSENKTYFLSEVRKMIEYLPDYDALGDFDSLMHELKDLEQEIMDVVDSRINKKQELCVEAEQLCYSTNWKETSKRMKELMQKWKEIGWIPKEKSEELWSRFRFALNRFYTRRNENFEQMNRERERNLDRKEELCREVESLDCSKEAIERVKEIQAEWKGIGSVPREKNDELWRRFREACDNVFKNAKIALRNRLGEVLEYKEQKVEKLRESIEHDEGNIAHWESVIDNLRPGTHADEIERSMREKISSVEQKIESKREKIRELESNIEDIRSKIHNL